MKRLIAASAIALAVQGYAAGEMNSPQAARHVLSLNDVEITAHYWQYVHPASGCPAHESDSNVASADDDQ